MDIKIKKKEVFTKKIDKTVKPLKSLGPISDLERHLPSDWWKNIFNSLYLKTDGDVVENDLNTKYEIDLLIKATGINKNDQLLDVCCGQGRHSIELACRGFSKVKGIDRSRYLIRLARKRALEKGLRIQFSEGDARKLKGVSNSVDCVFLLGNSFGYFEREEDDISILNSILLLLKSKGKLVLDIVDGSWMRQHFEARSWEWIDQQHFVNRERSLSADGTRIITREVITHAEKGILADQFYAERIYELSEIKRILSELGFNRIKDFCSVQALSTRGQDLGMMANRLFITCEAPAKNNIHVSTTVKKRMTVILGDHRLPDAVKKDGKFNTEDFETINCLKKALKKLNTYQISFLDNHKDLLQKLIHTPPDFVFNLCDEGFKNDAKMELHIPALLEILGVPYSGAAPTCLSLCYDKSKVRAIADSMGIPVAQETYYHPNDQAANIPSVFPALLKPAYGDSSIGITQNAVVYNAMELLDYLTELTHQFPNTPILIQEFLSGNEYSVGLIGNGSLVEVLPILEVNYDQLPQQLPKILSYESKWMPDSAYWQKISYHEALLSADEQSKLIDYSKMLFERLDCRDYARIDFRCDAFGKLKLLEVNPNPGWCWDGKLNLMAGFAGISYEMLLDKICKAAFDRYGYSI